nr:potassium channel family protein [Cellulomonas sp. APG4]
MWVTLLLVGFALVHWPFLGDGFAYSDTVLGPDRRGFLDALYVSGVLLATLGLGDVLPLSWPLRLLVPAQALVGFALLTAAVSWLIQLEAALARRRSLAHRADLLRRAGRTGGTEGGHDAPPAAVLDELAGGLARARVDLQHSTVTYVFTDPEEGESIAAVLPWVARVAVEVADGGEPGRAAAARGVVLAVDDLLELVDSQFLHLDGADRQARLRALAEQHGYPEALSAA